MSKGYWVANVDVENLDEYKKYIAANAEPFAKYGARFLTRGGKAEVVEGSQKSRIVVIEFKDFETARACYYSPEYQSAMKLRIGHSSANLAIVEGWEA
ncbi:MAG: DUF1330 domain-containing protein [Alphaproteobacteria bacterium]|nr:DUF1330 domain-containing protein [Alphaproteobacteria bacterium]